MSSHRPLFGLMSAFGILLLASCSEGEGITVSPGDPCAPVALSFPGSASGDLSATECRSGGRPAAFHRFSVTSARTVEFSVNGSFAPEVQVLTTPDMDGGVFVFDNSNSVTGVWHLPAGEYLLRVVAQSGAGTYNVSGGSRSETECIIRGLLPFNSVTYTRQLTNASCFIEEAEVFVEPFLFFSARPCTITMRSGQVDSFLIIRNILTGEQITFDDDSGGGLDAQVILPRCSAGADPMVIEATTFDARETGSYTLTVEVQGGPPVPGAAVIAQGAGPAHP